MSGRRSTGWALAATGAATALSAALVTVALTRSGEAPSPSPPPEPVTVEASLSAARHAFGVPIEATVRVLVDVARVDPGTIALDVFFRPYRPVGPARLAVERTGDVVVRTLRQRLQCVDRGCAPAAAATPIELPVGEVRYRLLDGTAGSVLVGWSPPVVTSLLDEAELIRLEVVHDAGLPPPGTRASPELLGWLAIGLSCLGLAALAVLVASRRRRPVLADVAPVEVDPLAEALARLAEPAQDADERRLRLDAASVALAARGELELAERARSLAWSPADPDPADVVSLVGAVRGGGG